MGSSFGRKALVEKQNPICSLASHRLKEQIIVPTPYRPWFGQESIEMASETSFELSGWKAGMARI